MTGEQLAGLIRTIIAALGGFLASKGFFDAATWQVIAGAVATVIVAIWSYQSKPAA